MSGEGVLPASAGANALVRRASVIARLEERAASVEASVAEDRVQPHSRMLPTEAEIDRARFAARQLRIAADDFRAGLEEGED